MSSMSSELVQAAVRDLQPIFSGIDNTVKSNLAKVLAAFREQRVGTQHFAGASGYGYNDTGRETLDRVFAQIVGAEAAIVRSQIVSGTHAITCALFGVLRPGDEMLSVMGAVHDTLEEVVGLRGEGQGSLMEFGISYREVPMTSEGKPDWDKIATAVSSKTKMAYIQRSCGYAWRRTLTIEEVGKIVQLIKQQNPEVICFVDNCYGEFSEEQEPTQVGVDLMAGSLIKAPGGTIITTGGYVAGRADLVEQSACRLTAPGLGSFLGAGFELRLLFQGLFLAPQMAAEAIKSSHLISYVFDRLGYPVTPPPTTPRGDSIVAIKLGSPEKMIAFCSAMQKQSPVGAYLEPIPGEMYGYNDEIIMAGGTFIQGSTSELSADGPIREPYIVYSQGGTHWTHMAIALESIIDRVGTV